MVLVLGIIPTVSGAGDYVKIKRKTESGMAPGEMLCSI